MKKKVRELSALEREKINRESNIVRYFAVFLVCLVYAYFFGGFFPFMLLYLSIALPIISLLHLIVIYTQFRVSQQINGRIFIKGTAARYTLLMENPTIFYMPYITVNMLIEGQVLCKDMKRMSLSLPPFANRSFSYELPLYYRGLYNIGVHSIEISDFLGLFSFTVYPPEMKSILVRPRIIDSPYLDIQELKSTEGSRSREHLEAGNDEIVNIRDYTYGDSSRKIHWKLSSKLRKYMVKETKNEQDKDSIFILNLNNQRIPDLNSLMMEDCLIEEIVADINYLLKMNMSLRLCFFKNGPQTVRAVSALDFQNIYNILSEVKFNQDYDFVQALDYFTEGEDHSNLLFIYTVKLDPGMIEKLIKLKNKGFDLQLFFVCYEGVGFEESKWRDIADLLTKNEIDAYRLVPSGKPAGGTENRAESYAATEGAEVIEA